MPEHLDCWDDGDDGRWLYLAKPDNNGEFDYWPVVEIRQDDEAPRDYVAHILIVAPGEVDEEKIQRAFDCIGLEPSDEPEKRVMALYQYGVFAPAWRQTGTNRRALLKAAREQLIPVRGLFGMYMDPPKNGIGATGWDLLRGEVFPASWREQAA